MVTNVTKEDFCQAFDDCNRSVHFTNPARSALFDYLEDLYDSMEQEYELDVIALCCEYTEYRDIEQFWDDYDEDEYPTMADIRDATMLIDIPDTMGFIIQNL